jgi:hypothetical protein
MPREMRFLDIPDGHPLPGDWRREINSEQFDAHIGIIEAEGPIFAGHFYDVDCKPMNGRMWMLRLLTGFGFAHHLVFIATRNGNLLALHGFTAKVDDLREELAIVEQRSLDLM